jgi:hypothetical protein
LDEVVDKLLNAALFLDIPVLMNYCRCAGAAVKRALPSVGGTPSGNLHNQLKKRPAAYRSQAMKGLKQLPIERVKGCYRIMSFYQSTP